jgi:riboflavin kinase/FMN adenylyltransferase
VRALVAAGDQAAANRLLTAPYRVTGTVVHGAHRGAGLGFPTANLAGLATLLPAPGVYAARAAVVGGSESYPAAVHVGPNATFGATAISVEAHLVGFTGDLYGSRLDVDFLERVRDTRRFDSIDELVDRMRADVARAAEIAGGIRATSAPRSEHAT